MSAKKKNHKVDSKEVGLELGLLVFKFFLKTEYLHYGYFIDGLEADAANLKKAHENYAELLFSHIPKGTKTILDVGCGSGKTAQQLLAKGFKVDCVSPSQILTAYAKKLLGDKVDFFQCKFEDIITDKKYDLVLFSESFQYIPMDKSIPRALELLNPGGYIMVSDFFNADPDGKSKLGGGHDYYQWLKFKESYAIKTLVEKDITAETSLTIDIVNQLNTEVLKPVWTSAWALGEDRFPAIIKFVRKFYKKKISKMENKHFTGQRNGELFRKYKKYMFYLFQAGK
ncbi:MAG: class I SAM-dependent methyltransferase [Bacteroidales bacterium]|nr:class I SAM-dependent methyltransferase [Bacteroidales bacterium]